MFKIKYKILHALTGLIMLLSTWSYAGGFKYVIIDAGHGGKDIGGHAGLVFEKHLALDTALRLAKYLKDRGVNVILTRTDDTFLSLARRVNISNKIQDAIFVSIHYNHSWKQTANGIETYFFSKKGKVLANFVQELIMNKLNTPNRGAKFARFYVIRHSMHPAILVECGFVSNAYERERMKKAWFRQRVVEGIGEGILKYR